MNQPNAQEQRVVLVIDSNLPGAETLRNPLADAGYRVYTCGTLNAALEVIAKKRIAVALLALGRPDLDPERCIQRLKKVCWDGKIPIIVIFDQF